MGIFKTSSFSQRITEKVPFTSEIVSSAINTKGEIYVSTKDGLVRVVDGKVQYNQCEIVFNKIYCDKSNRILASAENKLYCVTENKVDLLCELDCPITDIAQGDKLYVLTERCLYSESDGKLTKLQYTEQPGLYLAVIGDRVCISDNRCIQRLEGKRKTWRCIFPDHSTMPKINILSIAFDKLGNLLVGADSGLYIYDYKSGWYGSDKISVLPKEKVYSIKVCDDGSVFLGTDAGAVHIKNGIKKYLPAQRYAFNTDVKNVEVFNNDFYTFSQGGVVKIYFKEMTLEEKAYHFLDETEKYFPRKNGYVTHIMGSLEDNNSEITDNDGLWTNCYLAGLTMWYAVSKDKKVLKAAKKAKDAVIFLTKASEIKGFTARAVRYPDEKGWGEGLNEQSIGKEWHRSSDGSYEWLGETSSDELTGHYVGLSLYYDYCADEKEKAEIKEAICNMTDHIIEHNGYLYDFDNRPTTWACWNADALNNDSMWMWEKGVNSLEMLNFLKISHHMSGDEKYEKLYKELINEKHFLINASHHKLADGHMCHIDDNLAMLNSLTYLLLEKDSAVRQLILTGLSSHYEYEKIEGNPYFAFIYKGFVGAPCNVDMCVRVLEEYPYEIEGCGLINHNRKDIEYDDEPLYWGDAPRLKKPFGWDERPVTRLGLNPFLIDTNERDFVRSESGMSYIFIYNLGRFLEIIE